MTLLDVFRAARALLASPLAWRQGKYAGKRIGESAGPNPPWQVTADATLDDPEANCFCLVGAIDRVVGDADGYIELRHRARRELTVTVKQTPVVWNDETGRTHAEVLAAVDATIARLEAA